MHVLQGHLRNLQLSSLDSQTMTLSRLPLQHLSSLVCDEAALAAQTAQTAQTTQTAQTAQTAQTVATVTVEIYHPASDALHTAGDCVSLQIEPPKTMIWPICTRDDHWQRWRALQGEVG